MREATRTATRGILLGIVLSLIVGLVYALTQNTFVLLGVLGVYLSLVISLLFTQLERIRRVEEHNDIAAAIARSPAMGKFCRQTIADFEKASRFDDPVYLELFSQAMDDFRTKLAHMCAGVYEFQAEAWRRPWQQLLSHEDVTFYYSAALVKSPRYWHDKPGKTSIEFNKAVASRLRTKRVFIVWDHVRQDEGIRRWIADQQAGGIEVAVVLKSEIPPEEDLLHDFGIYGNRAVGYQFLDNDCSTQKFELCFDRETYQKTLERFRKLELYATAESTAEYLAPATRLQAEPA